MANLNLVPTRKMATNLRRLTSKEFRDGLAEVVEFTSRTRKPVVLTTHGKDRAALVPLEDLQLLEALELLKLRVDLTDCSSSEAAVWRLAEAANKFIEEYVGPGVANSGTTEVKDLLLEQKPTILTHLLPPSSIESPAERRAIRWSGCHLVREALLEGRRRGVSAEGRSLLLASLMSIVQETAEQIARDDLAVDDMHAVIELLETLAAAVSVDDEIVQQQFAESFAATVCRSKHQIVQCLLVWCIGELTERGKPLIALAQRMTVANLNADPPQQVREALRIVCSRPALAGHSQLKAFVQKTPLLRLKDSDRLDQICAHVSHWARAEAFNLVSMHTFFQAVGELVHATARSSPLELIQNLDAARRLLGEASKQIANCGPESDIARLFVERGCAHVVDSRRQDGAVPVFVIAETLEAIRDRFPRLFAQALARRLDQREPELVHGIVVCVAEGAEVELSRERKRSKSFRIPRFDFVPSTSNGIGCTFDPGTSGSDYSEFWFALADLFSKNNELGTMSPRWVNKRLAAYDQALPEAA